MLEAKITKVLAAQWARGSVRVSTDGLDAMQHSGTPVPICSRYASSTRYRDKRLAADCSETQMETDEKNETVRQKKFSRAARDLCAPHCFFPLPPLCVCVVLTLICLFVLSTFLRSVILCRPTSMSSAS